MDLDKLVSKADIELVMASDFFDRHWYLEQYKDVALLGIDPVAHYLWLGHRMGRSPSEKFCGPSYQMSHRDVKASGMNPLIHYLKSGMQERRVIYPVKDSKHEPERKNCKRIVMRRHVEWDWTAHKMILQRLEARPHRRSEDKVSVVMPTYNRAHMIDSAILSVLEQSHSNLELIIVDDHSSDNTAQIVSAIGDERIKFVINHRSKGVSGARNTALEIAEGQWIFFLDSDNAWKPNMIEIMLKHADLSQTSAGYCAANMYDDTKTTKSILYADFDYETCLCGNFVDLNCFFMRWSGAFQDFRFDESLRRLVDWDFILGVASSTRVIGIPFVGVDYYDGSSERITNSEHGAQDSIQTLVRQIQDKWRMKITRTSTIRDASSYRIAVHFHIYHPDRVPECLDYLQNIRFDFDLFVSTSLDDDHETLAQVRDVYPGVVVLHYPNAGADIAPFLELMSTFKNYYLLLKIHTKRDVEPWGNAWRKGLLDPVLGSTTLVDEIIEHFRTDSRLALACSADFYKHGVRNSIEDTLGKLKPLAEKVGLDRHLDKDWAFVAGTMFWTRPHLYLNLARHMCDSAGYSEAFLHDGAIEHGLERALGLSLWEDQDNLVALVSMIGEITNAKLGEGFSIEGVSQTMKRLYDS